MTPQQVLDQFGFVLIQTNVPVPLGRPYVPDGSFFGGYPVVPVARADSKTIRAYVKFCAPLSLNFVGRYVYKAQVE